MKITQLLYPFANVMGIFFPTGDIKDGGTCEYASERCKKECCAKRKGAATIINYNKKSLILNYFIENSVDEIVSKIINELFNEKEPILSWFASGDCPEILVKKMYKIVNSLKKQGIIQNGITRNINLWNLLKKLEDKNTRFLLTIEDDEDILEKFGFFAIPDYKEITFDVVYVHNKKKYVSDGCGGGWYTDHIKEKDIDKTHLKMDCKYCYENKVGCFIQFEWMSDND